MKLGTRKDHELFVHEEKWTQIRNARGSKGGYYATYELVLASGEILRTRISHPPDKSTYGAALWSHILRDQLRVTSQEFWDCVENAVLPDRGLPPAPVDPLPAQIVYQLIHTVGLPPSEVAAMSREEAIARLSAHWSRLL